MSMTGRSAFGSVSSRSRSAGTAGSASELPAVLGHHLRLAPLTTSMRTVRWGFYAHHGGSAHRARDRVTPAQPRTPDHREEHRRPSAPAGSHRPDEHVGFEQVGFHHQISACRSSLTWSPADRRRAVVAAALSAVAIPSCGCGADYPGSSSTRRPGLQLARGVRRGCGSAAAGHGLQSRTASRSGLQRLGCTSLAGSSSSPRCSSAAAPARPGRSAQARLPAAVAKGLLLFMLLALPISVHQRSAACSAWYRVQRPGCAVAPRPTKPSGEADEH